MAVLYITEQGASLSRQGNRIIVSKSGQRIQEVHAFKVDQIVIMGNVSLTPQTIAFLLAEGIDTVFMSVYGKYRGRLISRFGKNIDLRIAQFQKMGDPGTQIALARRYVQGKLYNCRMLLRRANRELQSPEITSALHQIRIMAEMVGAAESPEVVMGFEGRSAAVYFGCFGKMIRNPDFSFEGRNRRPPKDPVNVLLSLGYTLLGNAVQTQIDIAGLDPFLGVLHRPEYGRPSLTLDLIEEFRPVIVDSTVLYAINKKLIRSTDFYKPEDHEPAAFDFAETEPIRENLPIILTHPGMKKFIIQFEAAMNRKTMYLPTGKRLSYREICLEQVRLLVRHLKGEAEYVPYSLR